MTHSTDSTQKIGRGMWIAAWIAALSLMAVFFHNKLEQQHNPNQYVESNTASGYTEIVLQRNRFGHYVADGKINGHPVTFLLDTGATEVAIPLSLAREIGLRQGRAITLNTANGTATGYTTKVESVSLGEIKRLNVPAHIAPGLDDGVLLGMSFLKDLEIIQRGEQLTLRQYH